MKQFLLGTLLFVLGVTANGQNITKFEYFIDTDPGIGLATSASPTASATVTDFNIPISISSLSTGFHTVYIRGQNTAGTWTQTHFRVFYIVAPLAPPATTITQIEYFVDIDPGIGSATQVAGITPASTITNLPIDITASSYTLGFHTLYVRGKTAAGQWTQTHFRNFYVASLPTSNNLIKFEYFFDTDPGFDNGVATLITPPLQSVANQDIFAVPSSLSIGSHTIYVRGKDSSGNWTQVSTGTFSVTAPALPTITGFTPASGPAGTMVTITGTNFTGTTSVTFGGTAATLFTIVSPTTINATVDTGTSGTISVTNAAGTATSSTLFTITVPTTLVILPQPISSSVCDGVNASFTIAASGTTNITYQWQFSSDGILPYTDITNGGGYSNVTTSSLSVNTTGNFGAGFYQCKVNGDFAPTTLSNAAQLIVNTLPAAPTTQGASGCPSTALTLNASGGTNGQYVWYTAPSGGAAIPNEVNGSFTTPALTATTTYYVSINNGTCESNRTSAIATINPCPPPVIATAPLSTQIGGKVIVNLVPLITTTNSSLDLSSMIIVTTNASAKQVTLSSGATASIDAAGVLTIDYTGISFSGTENFVIKACDTNGNCASQQFNIDVAGDIIIYNGVSPHGINPSFVIQYIDILPDTKNNSVFIFDRWQNQVWHGTNYDNSSVVFKGISDTGNELPSGVYFYKIDFNSSHKSLTGFISLRR